jgi:hypothetical protein
VAKSVSAFGFLEGAQDFIAGWSSPVARQAHNLKVIGSNPIPATKLVKNPSNLKGLLGFRFGAGVHRNNINSLACGFKSPRNHAIVSRRNISQRVTKLSRHRYSTALDWRNALLAVLLLAMFESKFDV